MIFIPDANRKKRGNGIVKVSDLFAKYRTILKAPQSSVVQTFCDTVKELLGFTVQNKQCSYTVKTRMLHLSASGMLKTEILMHKRDILSKMEVILGSQNTPKDII